MDKAEQFIKDYTNHCSNELCAVEDRYGKKVISYHEWLTPEQALAAVEIAKEGVTEALRMEYEKGRADVIAKACQFLHDYQEYPDHDISLTQLMEAFKEAIKD